MIDSALLPIASFEDVFFPFLGVVGFLLIPITAILTRHQQKMAMLMRQDVQDLAPQKQPLPVNSEIYALRQDVQQLREMVSSLAINIDNLNDKVTRQSDMQERMKVGE